MALPGPDAARMVHGHAPLDVHARELDHGRESEEEARDTLSGPGREPSIQSERAMTVIL